MVGVITHVPALAERVPVRFVVSRDERTVVGGPGGRGRPVRFSVDPWDPAYGTSLDTELGASSRRGGRRRRAARRPLGARSTRRPGARRPAVLFVDGVRRVDAQVWVDEPDGTAPGARRCAPPTRPGVVCCCAADGAHLDRRRRVQRGHVHHRARPAPTSSRGRAPTARRRTPRARTSPRCSSCRWRCSAACTLAPDESDKKAGWLKTVSVPDAAKRLELLVDAPESSPQMLLETAETALEVGEPLRPGRHRGRPTCWPRTRGSGGRSGWPGWSRWRAATRRRRRRRSTRSTARCPASSRPSWRWRMACEHSGEPTSPRPVHHLRADRRELHRPRRVRAGRDPHRRAATSTVRSPRSTWCPDQRRVLRARRQRAGLLAGSGRGLPALAEAMDSIDGAHHRPGGPGPPGRERVPDRAGRGARDGRRRPADRRRAGTEPDAARRAGGGLPGAGRTSATSRRERIALVDQANEVRGWTLR